MKARLAILLAMTLCAAPALAQDDIVIGSAAPAPVVVKPKPMPVGSAAPAAGVDETAPVGEVPAGLDTRTYAAAQQLVKLFDMKALLQGMMAVLVKQMAPLVEQDNPGQGDRIEALTSDITQKVVAAHMADLEKNKAVVYAQLFTLPELQQLKKFYASPVGQKMMQETPEMMRRNATMDQAIMADTVREARKQLMIELKKNGLKIPKEMGA